MQPSAPSVSDIPGVEARRWKVRRRMAVTAFIHLVTMPFWGGWSVKTLQTPAELLSGLLWADVVIIGAYIGGVVIDDNWKR